MLLNLIRIFSGFKSRCKIFWACIYDKPKQIWAIISLIYPYNLLNGLLWDIIRNFLFILSLARTSLSTFLWFCLISCVFCWILFRSLVVVMHLLLVFFKTVVRWVIEEMIIEIIVHTFKYQIEFVILDEWFE